jgi:AraC family transcriptional regulator
MPFRLQLALGGRPKIAKVGLVEHGFRGREEYELPHLWCFHLYFYGVNLQVGGRSYPIIPGSVTLIPPRTRIAYNYTHKKHRHFFVHFSLTARRPKMVVPFLQHLPNAQDEILDRLQNIERVLTHNPWHAEILFWGVLCDIAEAGRTPPAEERKNTLLETVETFVEERLPGKITISEVAQLLGLSASQVNRTLKAAGGMTAAQLIRKQRLQRAYRLLLHSTTPVKLVASECGIDDLQQFNKLMRRSYGMSPRRLREHAPQAEASTWKLDRL